jgi:hypothetical protein
MMNEGLAWMIDHPEFAVTIGSLGAACARAIKRRVRRERNDGKPGGTATNVYQPAERDSGSGQTTKAGR